MMNNNMATNIATAEQGGYPEQGSDTWWLQKWSSWLATIGAVALGFVSILVLAFNIITFSLTNVVAGAIQAAAACIILAIEGSSVVAFLTFAKPISLFFEGKPVSVKCATYAGLTALPMVIGPSGPAVMLGFLISAGITAIYGMILIGRKGSVDSMRAAAAQQPTI